jgi:asparagine synthase (glutamine-hydrolysing)
LEKVGGEILNNNIVLHFRDKWNNEGNTFVRGRAFIQDELFEEDKLAEYFNKSSTEDTVNLANGFWGLVKTYENSILIAADRTRSYPLFYGVIDNIVYISDDAYWVKEKVGNCEFEAISKNELLLTGYVTGCDTLYKNVKQIQAGEIVSIDFDEKNNIRVSPSKYYNFIHGNYFENLSREQLLEEHEHSLLEAVNRLIEYANGRTIVIPLSGGYDSRLVATVLKKMNYSNVITFTYGRINNPESLVSKEVARLLGYKWIFIPYDNEKSFQWYNSIERKNFSTYGDNLSTILPDREWPAVWELKKQNLIPEDSVFAPGHSGDFISGGHLPENLCRENVKVEQFVDEILKKHYVMWKWNGVKDEWISDFSNKILNCAEIELFDKKDHASNDYASNAYEKWNWQENQVKRMANSVKIYDFFGYKYWLPLWDYEYMNFWCKVPLKYRINKNLYDEYVVNLYSQTTNITIHEAEKREPPLDNSNIFKKIWNKSSGILSFLLSKEKSQLSKEELRDTDWEQSSGRLTKEVYNILLPYFVGRSSCATLERLGYISYTSKDVPKATLDMLENLRNEKKL